MEDHRLELLRLTPHQRAEAKNKADSAFLAQLGPEPALETFIKDKTGNELPPTLALAIWGGTIVLLLSMFATSAIRLYHAGYNASLVGLPNNELAAKITGSSSVLGAELSVLVFGMATMLVLPHDHYMKRILWFLIGFSMVYSYVGNITIAKPHTVFEWLDTLFPTTAVLGGTFVLKSRFLHDILGRNEGRQRWLVARQTWLERYEGRDKDNEWRAALVGTLWDALAKKNAKRIGAWLETVEQEEVPEQLRLLFVRREIQAIYWTTGIDMDAVLSAERPSVQSVRSEHRPLSSGVRPSVQRTSPNSVRSVQTEQPNSEQLSAWPSGQTAAERAYNWLMEDPTRLSLSLNPAMAIAPKGAFGRTVLSQVKVKIQQEQQS